MDSVDGWLSVQTDLGDRTLLPSAWGAGSCGDGFAAWLSCLGFLSGTLTRGLSQARGRAIRKSPV